MKIFFVFALAAASLFILLPKQTALADVYWQCPATYPEGCFQGATANSDEVQTLCNNKCPDSAHYPCYSINSCTSGTSNSGGTAGSGITTADQALDVIRRIVAILYKAFFVIAAMFIIFSAYMFLTAGGDEEKVSKAKKQLLYAIIAIVIALLSYGVTSIIQDIISPSP